MRKRNDNTAIGEDAFLDTVANLVGILIILVVIVSVGTRAAAKIISSERIQEANEALEQPIDSAIQIEKELIRQAEQLAQHDLEIAYRNAERQAILEKVLVAKQLIEDENAKLDDSTRTELAAQQRLNELERQLEKLIQAQEEIELEESPTIILQHLPTPMAKTVFGKELHIMIKDKRITVIPWDRLVQLLKTEARNALARSTRKDRIVEQLGPIEGFIMDYALVSRRGTVSNGVSSSLAQTVELDKFELTPTADITRETLDKALGVGGRLRVELTGMPPRETTVTAWVYPDSFELFRQLKEALFVEGYMMAARPLPEEVRIGASPRGSQTSAQ